MSKNISKEVVGTNMNKKISKIKKIYEEF